MAMTNRSFKRRIHQARFARHNGNLDEHGNPTYAVERDWIWLPIRWPCEMLSSGGNETLRGRQTTATTSHVLYGEAYGCDGVEPQHRCEMSDGKRYSVVAVLDPEGLNTEKRIELKAEH